jgi:hypothetical protein
MIQIPKLVMMNLMRKINTKNRAIRDSARGYIHQIDCMPGLDILVTKKHVVRTQTNIFDDAHADVYGEQFNGFDFL